MRAEKCRMSWGLAKSLDQARAKPNISHHCTLTSDLCHRTKIPTVQVFVRKLQNFALLSPDMLLPLLVTTRCFVILSSLCPLSLSQWNLRLCDRDEDNFKICVILTPWCAVPVCFSQYCCCLSYFAVKSLESGGRLCIMFVVGGSSILKTEPSVS